MKCNLCIVAFKLEFLNFVAEFKTFIVISESPNIWRLLCPSSFASWHDFKRANIFSWLFVICPKPSWSWFQAFLMDRKLVPLPQLSQDFLLTLHRRRLRLYFSFATIWNFFFPKSNLPNWFNYRPARTQLNFIRLQRSKPIILSCEFNGINLKLISHNFQ